MPNEYNSELSLSKDIIKRLKAKPPKGFVTSPLMIEAADEIEWLREELKHSDEVRQSALQSLLAAETEIERFAKLLVQEKDDEIERLRGALRFMLDNDRNLHKPLEELFTEFCIEARKALEEKE